MKKVTLKNQCDCHQILLNRFKNPSKRGKECPLGINSSSIQGGSEKILLGTKESIFSRVIFLDHPVWYDKEIDSFWCMLTGVERRSSLNNNYGTNLKLGPG